MDFKNTHKILLNYKTSNSNIFKKHILQHLKKFSIILKVHKASTNNAL